jgi:hypothetical protein
MVANCKPSYARANRIDNSRTFVAQNCGKRMLRIAGYQVPIAMANPGGNYLHSHLAELWFGKIKLCNNQRRIGLT